jgi:hypothetical protein
VDWIIESVGCGGAWLDHDGDGDADLYLAQGATPDRPQDGPPDRLWQNDGDSNGDGIPEFSDVTESAGLGDRLWSFGAAPADYDNDGDDDLYLLNWGPNRLYRNNGDGTFTDVGPQAGVAEPGWGVSAAWSDVDLDGDLDLYVVNYVLFDFGRYPRRGESGPGGGQPFTWRGLQVFFGPRGLEPGHNVLFRNDGDPDGDGVPSFADVTSESGLVAPGDSYGLAAIFFDSDGDGDPDLFVANDSTANAYFLNRGAGRFEEQGVVAGLAYNEQGKEQASMGIGLGDFDGDGRFDLLVTNFSHDHDTLHHNDGGNIFSDVTFRAGLGDATYYPLGWGVDFLDLDQDGWEDLFIAHGHVYPQVDGREMGTTFEQRNGVFRNTGAGRFEEVGATAGPGLEQPKGNRALLPLDLDRDGDLDLALTALNDSPTVLRNDGGRGHWLQVRTPGTRSNRDGIGARVTLEAGGRRQVREVTRTASFAGGVLPVVHFGVGTATVIDTLEVRWPSGLSLAERAVAADQHLVLREPSGERE